MRTPAEEPAGKLLIKQEPLSSTGVGEEPEFSSLYRSCSSDLRSRVMSVLKGEGIVKRRTINLKSFTKARRPSSGAESEAGSEAEAEAEAQLEAADRRFAEGCLAEDDPEFVPRPRDWLDGDSDEDYDPTSTRPKKRKKKFTHRRRFAKAKKAKAEPVTFTETASSQDSASNCYTPKINTSVGTQCNISEPAPKKMTFLQSALIQELENLNEVLSYQAGLAMPKERRRIKEELPIARLGSPLDSPRLQVVYTHVEDDHTVIEIV